jgi:hypothetical protein
MVAGKGAMMRAFGREKGRKIHTRDIKLETYEYDDDRIVIEGEFLEKRLGDYQLLLSGEIKPAGVIHHMKLRWLFNITSLVIEDIEAEMLTVPYDECSETMKGLSALKGMRLSGGFTLKLKELVGGAAGCAHFFALLTAMAPAALQGTGAHYSQRPGGYGPARERLLRFAANSCYVWREDGKLGRL